MTQFNRTEPERFCAVNMRLKIKTPAVAQRLSTSKVAIRRAADVIKHGRYYCCRNRKTNYF